MLQTNLLLRKLGRKRLTVITCDGVIVVALCTSDDDILLNPLLYSQRYAPDKLNIAKLGRGVTP